jgi:uncharacterized protein
MHPDVCEFISEQFYDGRLHSHPRCATQNTGAGTGLRWIKADHAGCSTESQVEADLIAEKIRELLGQTWTQHDGICRPLCAEDFMVVAPYNDQVNLIRSVLDSKPETAGVAVGTVDKFQGREAPVVFFSLTASSAADVPRGLSFLLSTNRLNVAISRTQALALVVCSEDLLRSRAKSVPEMQLLAAINAATRFHRP